jgi:hypothetical protein
LIQKEVILREPINTVWEKHNQERLSREKEEAGLLAKPRLYKVTLHRHLDPVVM